MSKKDTEKQLETITKEDAENILRLLERVDLKGAEVPAFVQIVNKLRSL